VTERKSTATSNFGVSRREAHDSGAFYARFEAPEIVSDNLVAKPRPLPDPFVCGDARHMDEIDDGSVALVVTSPPYFAGKKYEEELGREGVPSSYLEYLEMLREVFGEAKRKLEPGGRIAVNVANLGRKPYRSLSADVIKILQDDLHLLLRGEVIWQKSEGASGSCAWGSFRSAANPVLRDLTERVVIASKGRFDRALSSSEREAQGLPFSNTLSSDEFMAATLDVWEIAPESARRVGHPAPFPVELPERLIGLYTYRDDLVLDPFMGSGSALVAASRLGRRYVGYDLDPAYVAIARARVAANLQGEEPGSLRGGEDDFQARAAHESKAAGKIAEEVVSRAGFKIVGRNVALGGIGLSVPLVALDAAELPWYFEVSGAFTTTRGGLYRADAVWRALGRAQVLSRKNKAPLVFLTSHLPRRGTEGDAALRAAGPGAFFDAVEMLSDSGAARLDSYGQGGRHDRALPGFWTEAELSSKS
jgi:site-specific DNA-methyltransferase (adenine-specific)